MCLAIPAKIISINGTSAELDIDGNRSTADITMVPHVKIGDYVIVHAGLAIQRYNEEEALRTLELFRELARINEAGL
jgi:hydrogenase expression/formation protein HypC